MYRPGHVCVLCMLQVAHVWSSQVSLLLRCESCKKCTKKGKTFALMIFLYSNIALRERDHDYRVAMKLNKEYIEL